MTVGDLISMLSAYRVDTEVVVQTTPTSWRGIDRIDAPCGDVDRVQRAVCLVPGVMTPTDEEGAERATDRMAEGRGPGYPGGS